MRRAKEEFGYEVTINFIWVRDPLLSVARVKHRQLHGAHHIPEDTIVRRYSRSIENFVREYQHLADRWAIYDNTLTGSAELIASKDNEGMAIQNQTTWIDITEGFQND